MENTELPFNLMEKLSVDFTNPTELDRMVKIIQICKTTSTWEEFKKNNLEIINQIEFNKTKEYLKELNRLFKINIPTKVDNEVRYARLSLEYFQNLIMENKIGSPQNFRRLFPKESRIFKVKKYNFNQINWFQPNEEDLLSGYSCSQVKLSLTTILNLAEISQVKTVEEFRQRFHNCYYQVQKNGWEKDLVSKVKSYRSKLSLEEKDLVLEATEKTTSIEDIKNQILNTTKFSLSEWRKIYKNEYLLAKSKGWWEEIKKWNHEVKDKAAFKSYEETLKKLGEKLGYICLGFDRAEYEGSSQRKSLYVKVQSVKYPDLVRTARVHLLKQGQNPFLITSTSPEWLAKELILRGEKWGK